MENTESISGFAETSREFCLWIECGTITDLQQGQVLLAELHLLVLELPRIEPNSIDRGDRNISGDEYRKITTRLRDLPINFYWEVLDPLIGEKEGTACGSLVDDLADIWRDLKNGLLNYEDGRVINAVFDWRTSFETHWGKHLVEAQRVIHSYLF
jgi:hypothetical protein